MLTAEAVVSHVVPPKKFVAPFISATLSTSGPGGTRAAVLVGALFKIHGEA